MKKTFRKLAAAVLTGVLALSLAGCGGDSKDEDDGSLQPGVDVD